jgi:tetratricopeptide (TPR) repeat protein
MAGKIFINYRRDDSISTAGRLHDRLAQTFGRNNLFMDVDHIPAGVDFVDYLNKQVAACDVFLAVIGPNWLDAKDDGGRRRFDNPDDFVTIEIAAALARNIRVMPVLVDGARTPKADRLPDSVKPLVRRNAVEVRNTHFGRDAEALTSQVGEALKGARPVTRQWPFMATAAARLMVAGSAMALLLVGWIGLYQMGAPVWVPWTPRPEQPDAPGADKAKAAAEAEARAKAEQAEQERVAAAKAEEQRKAKAAAEAEAKRKAEEAEQRRPAAAKAEEERRKQAEAEAQARYAALVNQSFTDISNGDYDRAIAAASEAMRLDPKDAIPVVNRGLAYSKKGDVDRAIADYTEAIRLNPNYVRAFNDRGVEYAKKGDTDRAIADYTDAIRLNPNYVMALSNRGNAYWKKGDNERAIADYTEVIRLNANNANALFNRGNAYSKKGDNERAIADYTEVIRLNPNNANAFNNRGFRYFKKGDNHRAIADYNEAIRLDPRHALAFCNRGNAKLKIHERSGQADIAKARELNSSICR